MKRRDFLKNVAAGACAFGGLSLSPALKSVFADDPSSANANSRPNIIFILSDDLGYGDLGCFGNPIVQTPNIDKLAYDGEILTQYYAPAPVCAPSRTGFVTGCYPYRTGETMSTRSRAPSLNVTFFPKLLRDAGYSNGVVGKWHLGHFPDGMPIFGFDEWAIDAPGGIPDYWKYTMYTNKGNHLSNGKYATDAITEWSLEFIDRHKQNPFFLYLAYNAPHFPLQAPDEDVKPFKNVKDLPEGAAIVYGMIKHMDDGIGKLVKKLKDEGLYDNTLIIFTSDNGPEAAYKKLDQRRYNGNFRGKKTDVYEGGIRVPAVIHWPKSLKSDLSTFPYLMNGVDWFPTLLAAAQVELPKGIDIDGENYLPALLGKEKPKDPKRFWSWNFVRPSDKSNSAMRNGPWKLERTFARGWNGWRKPADLPLPEKLPDWELYRIDSDPFEQKNIIDLYPDKANEMEKEFETWFAKVMEEYKKRNKGQVTNNNNLSE